jgi:phosphate starvation-inducible PhoH-like protein
LNEKTIELGEVDPLELYGVNEVKLNAVRKHFPKLKLVVRGDLVKAIGNAGDIKRFETKLMQLVAHLKKHKQLTQSSISAILESDGLAYEDTTPANENVILYGNKGLVIKAKTKNQLKLVEQIEKRDLLFAIGPAGTGKTYTAVAMAVAFLKAKRVRRIILTRPAVEAGENLGFLPGDLKEKLDPYLQPLYDALNDMIPSERLKEYMTSGVIQIAPLAFMRGRTLDHAFVILDEAQNATEKQLKMFLTRMGQSAKFVVTGDLSQVDLPKNQPSGLVQAIHLLKEVEGIAMIQFNQQDVMRHKLVMRIIAAYANDKKTE